MSIKTKTIVYIDGFNFYYGSLKSTPYKWLNIQSLFCDVFKKHNEIVSIKYYTARVSPSSEDPNVANRQDAFLRAIMTMCPLVSIYYGHFLRHRVNLENVAPPPRTCTVWKNEEKGSDVNLAVHIIDDAWKDNFQTAIVVSNDSDLAESLRIVKHEHMKTIGLVTPGAPKRKSSRQLSRYADFITPIRPTALRNHQLPLEVPGTRITKPESW
jgi:uncharacterized LabA/DUF88 family protein